MPSSSSLRRFRQLLRATRIRQLPRWNSHQVAKDVFQRIPPLSQLAVLFLAIYGPTHTPILFSLLTVFVHGVFVVSNARTAWGMRYACNAVETCAGTDWRRASGSMAEFDNVAHLIILPNYKETLDTLRETLGVLASHPAALLSYTVCLASEAAESGIEDKAFGLIEEFKAFFFDIQLTLHPRGIPGEAAGKSSNVSWAANEMHSRGRSGHLITVMDADTCFASDWFAAAASKYVRASSDKRRRLMFVAPIVFDRNASDVAAPIVCTDILWSAAGLGTMYEGSRAKLPTSAYAMSTELAARIGFWDAGLDAIGEDLHMAVKAFFETSGALDVEPIFSPASQCNVVGFRYPRTSKGKLAIWKRAHEWGSDLVVRYAQAKRHLWGSLDSGYALRRLVLGHHGVDSDLDIPSSEHLEEVGLLCRTPSPFESLELDLQDGSYAPQMSRTSSSSSQSSMSWDSGSAFSEISPISPASSAPTSAEASPALLPTLLKTDFRPLPAVHTPHQPYPLFNLVILMSRLYEAHFNLGFLFLLLTVAPYFSPGLEPMPLWKLRPATDAVGNAFALPQNVLLATAISSHLGTLAFFCTASIFFYNERYHHITTTKRWEGRPHLGRRANQQSVRKFPWCATTYVALPFTLLFGIVPLYHAQLCHLLSNRLTYEVSAKPSAPPTFTNKDAIA